MNINDDFNGNVPLTQFETVLQAEQFMKNNPELAYYTPEELKEQMIKNMYTQVETKTEDRLMDAIKNYTGNYPTKKQLKEYSDAGILVKQMTDHTLYAEYFFNKVAVMRRKVTFRGINITLEFWTYPKQGRQKPL